MRNNCSRAWGFLFGVIKMFKKESSKDDCIAL